MIWFLIHLLLWLVCGVVCPFFAKMVVRESVVRRQGFLVTAVIKIGRMTNITEVLVQIKSNKREGKTCSMQHAASCSMKIINIRVD